MRKWGAPVIGAAVAAVAACGIRRILRRRRSGEDTTAPDQSWVCACGAEYRLVGTGRHRVIWPADGEQSDAVMGGECPACGRSLAA
jgi:hypothetical protein